MNFIDAQPGIDAQKLSQAMALISIGGFAVQRAIELLDPLLAFMSYAFAAGLKKVKGALAKADAPATAQDELPWGLTETGLKTWLIGIISFLIGLIIARQASVQLVSADASVNQLVIALAISLGTNGINSLLKYAEYAKDIRKVEVKPLPVITITPAAASVKAASTIQFLASVSGTDNREVKWELLEPGNGSIDSATGLYTAPSTPGIYHVAAISRANEAATATATITVA
ncbi:MAG TPA: Ig-like domain-containing protein [Pyrinomonadaceae bacterium]|nr:Ig-like domain-containing protein [Pyrinomonadaceae bacterium]